MRDDDEGNDKEEEDHDSETDDNHNDGNAVDPKRESSFVDDLIGRVTEISYRLPRRLMMREREVSG